MAHDDDDYFETPEWRSPVDFDRLREAADYIRASADITSYGYFAGGDPREFSPDAETNTDEEMEAHRLACEAWERGECADIGGPHTEVVTPIATIRVTVAHYGLGVQTLRCPETLKLAQDLDDWIDRARQAGL